MNKSEETDFMHKAGVYDNRAFVVERIYSTPTEQVSCSACNTNSVSLKISMHVLVSDGSIIMVNGLFCIDCVNSKLAHKTLLLHEALIA